ncbi:MAG: hypothetical protein K9N55_08180 [Phycisphaerae bacterium]|nr:hypothetical protein [Phycisphaerae bacterium]
MSKNLFLGMTVTVVMLILFVCSCQQSAPTVTSPPMAETPDSQMDEFEILERKHVNETLVFNVTMRHLDAAKAMAEVLVLSNPQESKIQIFFHETGPAEGIGNAQLLYEWTGPTGLALRYDLRLPPPTESLDQSFPEYKVLSKKKTMDKRVFADILVPSLSDRTPAKEIERVCRIIRYEEGMDDCAFFTTMDAYLASQSSVAGQDNPVMSKSGVLCFLKDGKFILAGN